MKIGRYLIVFLLFIALLIAFGNNGIIDNFIMKEKLKMLKQSNSSMAGENNQLKHEISLLKNNPQHIESIARNEFGMVKKGEIVYRFSE
jgi:cell division protein FtsB